VLLQTNVIRTDGGTQPRLQLSAETINDYAESMGDGVTFPPVVAFYDGSDYWLADGFHRLHAAQQLGLADIAADVRQGTIQDARWYSYSVNQAHGLRRSNEDKRRAVDAAIEHTYEYHNPPKSNRDVSTHCGVSLDLVNRRVQELRASERIVQIDTRTVTRNGNTYEMNTANIGQRVEYDIDDDSLTEYEQRIADQYLERQQPTPDQINRAHVMSVMGSSESPEWYTPTYIVDLVSQLFEVISTDPCSNSHESPNVPAETLYTKADDGLSHPWYGNVYMNPPYGDEIGPWIDRMVELYRAGDIDQAIALLPARIDTLWFQPLYAYPMCNVRGRVKFQNAENSAPFPSIIVYLGADEQGFIDTFKHLGPIMKRVA
jgi:hypothetical protein